MTTMTSRMPGNRQIVGKHVTVPEGSTLKLLGSLPKIPPHQRRWAASVFLRDPRTKDLFEVPPAEWHKIGPPPSDTSQLFDLKVQEVSLCDRPVNLYSQVALIRKSQTTKAHTTKAVDYPGGRVPSDAEDAEDLPVYRPRTRTEVPEMKDKKEKKLKCKEAKARLQKIMKGEEPSTREGFAAEVRYVAIQKHGDVPPDQAEMRYWREHPEYQAKYESLPKSTRIRTTVAKHDPGDATTVVFAKMESIRKKDPTLKTDAIERQALAELGPDTYKAYMQEALGKSARTRTRKDDANGTTDLPVHSARTGSTWDRDAEDAQDADDWSDDDEAEDRDDEDEEDDTDEDAADAADQDDDDDTGMRGQIKRKRTSTKTLMRDKLGSGRFTSARQAIHKSHPSATSHPPAHPPAGKVLPCPQCQNPVAWATVAKQHSCNHCGYAL